MVLPEPAWPTLQKPMRFLDHTSPDIYWNLGLDEALLLEVEEGHAPPILRIWEQPNLTVVLGASGRVATDVNHAACDADGVPITRRSSGGGTVVIGPGALNFTLILPVDADPAYTAVDTAQRAVLARSAEGLNRLLEPGATRIEMLGSGDLTLGARKCSGSAQRRLRRHFLVHASLLYEFPLDRIGRYLYLPHRQPEYRQGRSHEDFVVNFRQTRANLVSALRLAWNAGEELAAPTAASLKFANDLVETKLARPDWIWRL